MENFTLICAYILSAVLGLCVGSFLNVVIYRLPRKMSLATPPSHCTSCNYELRWYDNIPVISYILLGGRCRSCKAHISIRYTIVELVNAALWVLSVHLLWERSIPLALIYAAAFSIFICIFFIDLEHLIILDRFQVMLIIVGILSIFFDKDFDWLSHIIGGVSGFIVFFLIAFFFEKLYKTDGLGGGDVKLAGAAGLLLGWERLLLSMLIATVPAAIIMSIVKHGKTGEDKLFPFAPFLIIGFCASLLFGTQIIDWYLSLFGL